MGRIKEAIINLYGKRHINDGKHQENYLVWKEFDSIISKEEHEKELKFVKKQSDRWKDAWTGANELRKDLERQKQIYFYAVMVLILIIGWITN